jgi:hypothetical protein
VRRRNADYEAVTTKTADHMNLQALLVGVSERTDIVNRIRTLVLEPSMRCAKGCGSCARISTSTRSSIRFQRMAGGYKTVTVSAFRSAALLFARVRQLAASLRIEPRSSRVWRSILVHQS